MAETTEIQQFDSGLSVEKHNAIANKFNPFCTEVGDLIERARGIAVDSAEDVAAIKAAREIRLSLRSIRVNVEHARKALKEESLREGKAIDGMANVIKYMIVPVEKHLQEQEDFVKNAEAKRVAALAEDRRAELEAFGVDCAHFDLGDMAAEAYALLLSSSEAGYMAKIEAERQERERQESERIAREKAELERRAEAKRLAEENARLRKAEEKRQREDAKRRAAEERAKREAEKKEATRLAEEERARREAVAAEERAAREAAEAEQARLSAPDGVKIAAFAEDISGFNVPAVSSDVAMSAVRDVRKLLGDAVSVLHVAEKALAGAAKK